MKHLIAASLVLVGLIHLLPLTGVLGGERLAALYGLPLDEPNIAILMRHRAVLLGLLGAFLLWAAFVPSLQALAFIAGWVSVGSFLWLAWSQGGYNAAVQRVVITDAVALVCLTVGLLAWVYQRAQLER
ncbi:phosphopantetheine adenylyltransferase [Hydrogenophaga sp.]|uniref:phosphopantetheine adenylyltransferase n=1 Tax=Hydrogenophaga sp. TaxID=1904254 RepID=UPI00356706A4